LQDEPARHDNTQSGRRHHSHGHHHHESAHHHEGDQAERGGGRHSRGGGASRGDHSGGPAAGRGVGRPATSSWTPCATDPSTAMRSSRRWKSARRAGTPPAPAPSTPPCSSWKTRDWCAPNRKLSGASTRSPSRAGPPWKATPPTLQTSGRASQARRFRHGLTRGWLPAGRPRRPGAYSLARPRGAERGDRRPRSAGGGAVPERRSGDPRRVRAGRIAEREEEERWPSRNSSKKVAGFHVVFMFPLYSKDNKQRGTRCKSRRRLMAPGETR